MDEILKELKALALEYDIEVITAKAPLLTEEQQARIEAAQAYPFRFIDYSGILRA